MYLFFINVSDRMISELVLVTVNATIKKELLFRKGDFHETLSHNWGLK